MERLGLVDVDREATWLLLRPHSSLSRAPDTTQGGGDRGRGSHRNTDSGHLTELEKVSSLFLLSHSEK